MKELVGHTLTGYKLDSSRDMLTFHTTKGDIVYTTEGDCCSQSWFESIDPAELDADELKKAQVKAVEEIELAEVADVRDKSLILYGILIKCEFGNILVEFRNASNGYYGGWCKLVRDETKRST